MCNSEFLSKDTDKTWEYLNSLTKNSRTWKTEDTSEGNQPITTPPNNGGLLKLGEAEDIDTGLIMLTKKVDYLLTKRPKIVKVMEKVQEICDICKLQKHIT